MSNGVFKLGWADLGKGLVVAVVTALIVYFQTLIGETGFTFGTMNWPTVINISVSAALAYLAKNLITSDQGNLGGIGDK